MTSIIIQTEFFLTQAPKHGKLQSLTLLTPLLHRYIHDFEGTLLDSSQNETDQQYIDRLVGNPIHAFNLIRRFTVDIPSLEQDLKEDDWKGK